MNNTTLIQPWERQDDETGPAFEAFAAYRNLGAARTLSAAAEQTGKHLSSVKRWSVRNQWVDRVLAYDRYVDTEILKAEIDRKLENRARRIKIGDALLTLAAIGLRVSAPEGEKAIKKTRRILEDGTVTETEQEVYIRKPWSPSVTILAARIAVQELRKEYDDEPTRREKEEARDEGTLKELTASLNRLANDPATAEQFAIWDREQAEQAAATMNNG